MPAATGGKPGRADSGCEISDGREVMGGKPNVRLRNGAGGGLNEKIRREKVRTAKDGSKEPFFF